MDWFHYDNHYGRFSRSWDLFNCLCKAGCKIASFGAKNYGLKCNSLYANCVEECSKNYTERLKITENEEVENVDSALVVKSDYKCNISCDIESDDRA